MSNYRIISSKLNEELLGYSIQRRVSILDMTLFWRALRGNYATTSLAKREIVRLSKLKSSNTVHDVIPYVRETPESVVVQHILFDIPDKHGTVITRKSISTKLYNAMVDSNEIISYEINEFGVAITKELTEKKKKSRW